MKGSRAAALSAPHGRNSPVNDNNQHRHLQQRNVAVVPQPRIQEGRALFPEVLHSMVDYCDSHHNHVLCWMDDGNGFVVKDRRFFEFHILPLYFRHGRFGSLERQLANYGFRRDGRGIGFYRHEHNLFQRDRPELASSIPLRRQQRAQNFQNPINNGNNNNNNNIGANNNPNISNNDANQPPNNGHFSNNNESNNQRVMPFVHQPASSDSSSVAGGHQDSTLPPNLPHMSNVAASLTGVHPSVPTIASHSSANALMSATVQGQSSQTMMTRPGTASEQQDLEPRFDNMQLSESSDFHGSTPTTMHGSPQAGDGANKLSKKIAVLPAFIPNKPEHVVVRRDLLSGMTNTLLEPLRLDVSGADSSSVADNAKDYDIMATLTAKKGSGCNTTDMVGVTGPAGVGKTTIVSFMVRSVKVRESFPEGIAWVDLTSTEIKTVRNLIQIYKHIGAQVSLTDTTINLPPLDEALASFRGVTLNRNMKAEGFDEEEDDDEEEGGGINAQMEYIRSLVSATFVRRKMLIILDDLRRTEDLKWFNFGFDDEMEGPCRVLVTTRLRYLSGNSSVTALGGHSFPMVEVPPMGEQDAVTMLMRHSGRGHVAVQEEEHARRIVHLCDCLPFAIEIAAHATSVRYPNTYSLASLAQNSDPLFQAGGQYIINTLDKSFTSVWDPKTKELLKLMFAGIAKLPYNTSGRQDPPVSAVRPWLPYSAVEKAMGDAAGGGEDDMGDHAKIFLELNLECLRSLSCYASTAMTNVVLLALGTLLQLRLLDEKRSVVKDPMGSETISFEYQVSHDLLIRYADYIISEAGGSHSLTT